MKINLPVSQEILTAIARMDRFQGIWSVQQLVPRERLPRLEEAARIQSVGASCRLGGMRVTDHEVAALLRGEDLAIRDSREVLGYAAAATLRLPGVDTLMGGEHLQRLHAVLIGATEPSPWRSQALYREGFDAAGHATGHVFSTLPARMVEQKTEELLTWLEFELRSGEQHPVLVTGAFTLCLLVASPFERGNGRLARVLSGQLLRRAGYTYVPYSSYEAQMEQLRSNYFQSFSVAQTRIWTDESDPTPWLRYFVEVFDRHRERLEAMIELERDVTAFPPLQRRILETVREHGNVDAALLIKATGANRNTLKDNLRKLVQRGVLERTGQRRGTRYRMATGTQPAGEAFEN